VCCLRVGSSSGARRVHALVLSLLQPAPRPPLFPYTTLFRSRLSAPPHHAIRTRVRQIVKQRGAAGGRSAPPAPRRPASAERGGRSEEHTSELQSRFDLVCRLLLDKKKELSSVDP